MLNFKKYILLFLTLFVGLKSFSQCDFADEIAVTASGFENGAGYTQQYVLVDDVSGNILVINGTGTFSSLAGGEYRVYAVNYLDAAPSELAVSSSWADVETYATNHCFEFIGPYSGSSVTVCNSECNGSNIVATASGFNNTASFEERYVLVNGSGTILAANGTGTFTPANYGSAAGVYTVYAVNTDDAAVKAEIDDLGPWSGVTALEATTCFDILGPRYFEVTAGIGATFAIEPDCGGGTALFDVNVTVTDLNGAPSVNIKDAAPTTHESAVGLGTYSISGYASGSSQTITVENSSDPSDCPISSNSLSFTCLTLGACAAATTTSTAFSETFEGGTLGGFTASGSQPFANTTTYYKNGSRSMRTTGHTSSATNTAFSTSNIDLSNYTSATLTFWHIAKTEGTYDECHVEISENGGSSYTPIPNSEYSGSATDYSSRTYFHEDSYADWGTTDVAPNNATWWKQETFDLTNYVGQNDVRIRFRLESDVSTSRSGGWIIDDVEISGNEPTSDPNVSLLASVGSTTSYPQCVDGDWTYYAVDGSSPYLFAVNWSPDGSLSASNENARDASQAIITLDNDYTSATDLSSGAEQASYSMKRYWNVDFSTGYNLDEDVKVRFFYDAAEKTAIETAATTFAGTYAAANYEGFEWFKTSGSNFDPSTDVNAADIAAGGLVQDATGTENSVTYVDLSGVSSFSGGTGGTGAGPKATPLPAELLTFWGEQQKENNKLNWETASEHNVEKYEILSSADGISFVSLGEQLAVGNSNIANKYSFVHNKPAQINYYQLKTIDFDGSEEFSNIILLRRNDKLNNVNIYPNPFSDVVILELKSEKAQCNIYDVTGKLILSKQISSNQTELRTSKLAKGTYTIELVLENNTLYKKLIKN